MSYELVIQREVINELEIAFEWYELQHPGLGSKFLLEIETALEKLCYSPLNYSITTGGFRKVKVRRFPYLLIFDVESNAVVVRYAKHISRG